MDTNIEKLGSAVVVNGKVVAWFADFTEEARDWCTENYFGQWLTWRSKRPRLIPLTDEELADANKRAAELMAHLKVE